MQPTFQFAQAADLRSIQDRLAVHFGKIRVEERPDPVSQAATLTLNFSSLRGRAFVFDTHVLRVLRRFGFVGENAAIEDACDAVMASADGSVSVA